MSYLKQVGVLNGGPWQGPGPAAPQIIGDIQSDDSLVTGVAIGASFSLDVNGHATNVVLDADADTMTRDPNEPLYSGGPHPVASLIRRAVAQYGATRPFVLQYS